MDITELKIAYNYGIEIGNHSNELDAIKKIKINEDIIDVKKRGYESARHGSGIVNIIAILTKNLLMKR